MAEKLKLLGTIAATTFERGQYFFEKAELLDIIAGYWQQANDCPPETVLDTRFRDSEAILQAIQLQHGLIVERAKEIYSFSHLTFQEYLTARKILYQTSPEALDATVADLATHTLDPNWQEVLRLSANMMSVADSLLAGMYEAMQGPVMVEPDCRAVLEAIADKAVSIQSDYHPAAIRAFYLTLFSDRDLRLATALDPAIGQSLESELALELALARSFEIALGLRQSPDLDATLNLVFALQLDQKYSLDPPFQTAFTALKEQLPDWDDDQEPLAHWWGDRGDDWLAQFQALLMEHRQIGHFRQLSAPQRRLLQEYYQLHIFWVDCWHESHTTQEFAKTSWERLIVPKN